MFQNRSWQEKLLDSYLAGSCGDLPLIAEREGVSLKDCQAEWSRWDFVVSSMSRVFQAEPSALSVNKILAHARDRAPGISGWRAALAAPFAVLNPVPVMTGMLAAVALGVLAFRLTFAPSMAPVAANASSEEVPALTASPSVKAHALKTPLDFRRQYAPVDESRSKYNLMGPVSGASPVSFGTKMPRLDVDAELDAKIGSQVSLDAHDVDALYFRARKWERLGHYREALFDYQFLAKFYPDYENQPAIQLAIANCLEGLKDKSAAIHALEKFENNYGASEGVEIWLDDLKSEAF